MFLKIKMWQLWKKYVLGMFTNVREPYHIGFIKASKSVDEIEAALIELGYSPDYTSYGDKGQITSMRKLLIDPTGGYLIWRQNHVRVFSDGEITGHNELAPEEDAEAHLKGITIREIEGTDWSSSRLEKSLLLAKLGGEQMKS